MLVDGDAVWENDRGDGKSLVRDDAVVVDFKSIKLMKLYIRKQLRTQIHN
jgi:ribosomal protein L24E